MADKYKWRGVEIDIGRHPEGNHNNKWMYSIRINEKVYITREGQRGFPSKQLAMQSLLYDMLLLNPDLSNADLRDRRFNSRGQEDWKDYGDLL